MRTEAQARAQQEWRAKNPERTRAYSREAYRSKRAKRIDKMDRSCQRCSEAIPFERSAHAKYCSDDCNYQAQLDRSRERTREGRKGRNCEHCSGDIPLTRNGKATTCSTQCRDALNERQWNVRKCRQLTHYAVKVGRLKRLPCEVCKSPDVEMHHVDYFEPLNVRWLCFEHHRTLMHGQTVKERN